MENNVYIYILSLQDASEIDEKYAREHFPKRYERALRFRQDADKLRCIAAGTLLSEILGVKEDEIRREAGGKLYVPGKPYFNLSHSGEYAVLAVASDIVGVDIEQADPRHLNLSEKVFTAEEISWMNADPEKRFFTLWTMKEAVSKAVGKGLSLHYAGFGVLPLLAGESITVDGVTLYGNTDFRGGYALSAAYAGEPRRMQTENVKLPEKQNSTQA